MNIQVGDWKKASGFTIVELLIVIVVIAILAALAIVSYNGISQRAASASAQSATEQAAKSVLAYMVQNNETPPVTLAAAGVDTNGTTTYEYTYTMSSFCLSAVVNSQSYFIDNDAHSSPTAGICPVTNLVSNPSFETTGGLPATALPLNRAGYTWAYSTGVVRSGDRSISVTAPATVADSYLESQSLITVPAGVYTASIWVYLTGAERRTTDEMSGSGVLPGGVCSAPNPRNVTYDQSKLNQWQRVTATFTASATVKIWVRLYGPTGATTYFDDLMITQGSTLHDYADGDTPGWRWDGVPSNSSSTGPAL